MKIIIRGRGIAALTAAWILAERGFQPILVGSAPDHCLRVAINADTVGLLNDIFELRIQELPSAFLLRGRIVHQWNDAAETVFASSVSIELAVLKESLEQRLRQQHGLSVMWCEDVLEDAEDTFTFEARGTGQLPHQQASSLSFGNRVVTMASLNVAGPIDLSIVEKTELGWLFFLPASTTVATLFLIAARTDLDPQDSLSTAVERSSFCSSVRSLKDVQPWRRIAPRLYHPLADTKRIRIGEAAFSFDPVCGDGIGYAIRSALLAATALIDLTRGELRGLEYYCARLARTFCAHLQGCAKYYSGWNSHGWNEELLCTTQGIAYVSRCYKNR